jgi:hypothetical protein
MPVTKKQFEDSYRKFPPSKCELFYIKRISASSLSRNIWPAILMSIGLVIPFLLILAAKTLGLPHCLFPITTFIYITILASVGVYSFGIWYKRRKRIESICNDLKMPKQEYEEIVNRYYYENYFPDIKDYIMSISK